MVDSELCPSDLSEVVNSGAEPSGIWTTHNEVHVEAEIAAGGTDK